MQHKIIAKILLLQENTEYFSHFLLQQQTMAITSPYQHLLTQHYNS